MRIHRFLHYYLLNEIVCLALAIWLFSGAEFWVIPTSDVLILTSVSPDWCPRFVVAGVLYVLALALYYSVFLVALLVGRQFRASAKNLTFEPRFAQPVFETVMVTARDGQKLKVQIANSSVKGSAKRASSPSPSSGNGSSAASRSSKPVMLLAAPLGQCGPSIYAPIYHFYGDAFTYIFWDYRGFYSSSIESSPDRPIRTLSISEHARDALDILTNFGYEKADVVCGHSMGTIVALEMSLLAPSRVGSMVLLNGFHGSVFSTAFQPVFRIPMAGDILGLFLDAMLTRPMLLSSFHLLIQPTLYVVLPIYARLFGSPLLRKIQGDTYLFDFMNNYFGNLCTRRENVVSYLTMFQELNAHDVHHLLRKVQQPVMIISGFLDWVTPPLQSIEICRKIPNSKHYCDPLSSHASILESPEWCVAEIDVFIRGLSWIKLPKVKAA